MLYEEMANACKFVVRSSLLLCLAMNWVTSSEKNKSHIDPPPKFQYYNTKPPALVDVRPAYPGYTVGTGSHKTFYGYPDPLPEKNETVFKPEPTEEEKYPVSFQRDQRQKYQLDAPKEYPQQDYPADAVYPEYPDYGQGYPAPYPNQRPPPGYPLRSAGIRRAPQFSSNTGNFPGGFPSSQNHQGAFPQGAPQGNSGLVPAQFRQRPSNPANFALQQSFQGGPPLSNFNGGSPPQYFQGRGPPPQNFQGGPPPQHFQGGPPPQNFQGGPPQQHFQAGPPPQNFQGGSPQQNFAPPPGAQFQGPRQSFGPPPPGQGQGNERYPIASPELVNKVNSFLANFPKEGKTQNGRGDQGPQQGQERFPGRFPDPGPPPSDQEQYPSQGQPHLSRPAVGPHPQQNIPESSPYPKNPPPLENFVENAPKFLGKGPRDPKTLSSHDPQHSQPSSNTEYDAKKLGKGLKSGSDKSSGGLQVRQGFPYHPEFGYPYYGDGDVFFYRIPSKKLQRYLPNSPVPVKT